MVGKGFITDAEDIICPECAKKKLMADTVEQWNITIVFYLSVDSQCFI